MVGAPILLVSCKVIKPFGNVSVYFFINTIPYLPWNVAFAQCSSPKFLLLQNFHRCFSLPFAALSLLSEIYSGNKYLHDVTVKK